MQEEDENREGKHARIKVQEAYVHLCMGHYR